MDPADDESPTGFAETEMKELLGLYDAPSFARRGQDVEAGLKLLHARCVRERTERLEMVRMRLRQWAAVAQGPESARLVFRSTLCGLWPACGVEPPARWSDAPPNLRKLRAAGRDLVGGIERFNRRWSRFVEELGVGALNQTIERYNRYYLLEKECCLGSARLAARMFVPHAPVTPESLLRDHPLLPVPEPL